MGCWVFRSCLGFLKVGDTALLHPYSIFPSISTIITPAPANTLLLPVYRLQTRMFFTRHEDLLLLPLFCCFL